MLNNYKNILWDFDGVILDSMTIRDWGFTEIFRNYDVEKVNALLEFHRENGGLSRYVKIRYFFNKVLNQPISDEEVDQFAKNFSVLMKKELPNPNYLINDAVNFIKKHSSRYNFHIVSGSDQEELRWLCQELRIDTYFKSIHGSPTPKVELVEQLIKNRIYLQDDTCLIGDSINDYEAAHANNIDFIGYNNLSLKTDISDENFIYASKLSSNQDNE